MADWVILEVRTILPDILKRFSRSSQAVSGSNSIPRSSQACSPPGLRRIPPPSLPSRRRNGALKGSHIALGPPEGRLPRKRQPTGSARWCSRDRSEEHTSELQSLTNLVCRLLLEKKKNKRLI